MSHLHRRSICKKCRVVFVRDHDIQVYCNGCLVDETYNKIFEHKLFKRTCQGCGSVFKTSNKQKKFCSRKCQPNPKLKDSLTDEQRFEQEAERWLNKKERKGNPAFPGWDEINRRAEYNRVFGKKAFNHYLKGRKWDYI